MTQEEAIVVLQKIKPAPRRADGKSTTHTLETIALDMAIEALEQEPCDDCISREQAIKATYGFERYTGINEAPHEYAESILRDLPSVTPQLKTGHWIWTLEDWNKWECSECGYTKRTDVHVSIGYKFCPKCGCRMESEG